METSPRDLFTTRFWRVKSILTKCLAMLISHPSLNTKTPKCCLDNLHSMYAMRIAYPRALLIFMLSMFIDNAMG